MQSQQKTLILSTLKQIVENINKVKDGDDAQLATCCVESALKLAEASYRPVPP